MSLLGLANELLLSIAENLSRESDINALTCINRRLYSLLNLYLYRYQIQSSNKALLWGVYYRIFNTVRTALDVGANVRATNKKCQTVLHLASARGHLSIVNALIQSDADVNAQTSTGTTPLHIAVEYGFERITQALIENGADFRTTRPGWQRSTVLHIASFFGFTPIVQLLLTKGMNIEVKDKDWQTPLHYAVKVDEQTNIWKGNIETVIILLEKKANKDAWDRIGSRPMDLSRRNPNPVIELLFRNGADINLDMATLILDRQVSRKARTVAKNKEREKRAEVRAQLRCEKVIMDYSKKEAGKIEREGLDRETEEMERLANSLRLEKHDAIRQDWAKIRAQGENRSQRLNQQTEEQVHRRNKEGRRFPNVSGHEKLRTVREDWAKMRSRADERNQGPNRTIDPSPDCCHSALGWLKPKGKFQCQMCGTICAKYSFRCPDCSLVTCSLCKTRVVG